MSNKPLYTVRQWKNCINIDLEFELKKADILKNISCSTIEKLQEFEFDRVK